MEDLRYPIGQFVLPEEISQDTIEQWINELEGIPQELQDAIVGLNDEQLDTSYRPDGWTLRQVVHHLADGNINAYIRFKLALTEDEPIIVPFNEERWADLSDSVELRPEVSVSLLRVLHKRWVKTLRGLNQEDFQRSFIHPEGGKTELRKALGFFVWHGKHHIAHITSFRNRKGI
ncbi:MAG TPA: putative metal-dependent hydrolase [Paenibacillaceae bacterium]|nr:putative metal-dependent hydrolase [Paenibacillaceae bacterium]